MENVLGKFRERGPCLVFGIATREICPSGAVCGLLDSVLSCCYSTQAVACVLALCSAILPLLIIVLRALYEGRVAVTARELTSCSLPRSVLVALGETAVIFFLPTSSLSAPGNEHRLKLILRYVSIRE